MPGIPTNVTEPGSRHAGGVAGLGEILVVFAVGVAVIAGAKPWVGENPVAQQAAAWVANVLMLALVWLGLRWRGQTWRRFGLPFARPGRRAVLRAVLASFAVFAAGAVGFMIGAVIMANIVGVPEGADMSGYDYLRGNLLLTILALPAVYIGSSLCEEVIYRGFLINRVAELAGGGKAGFRLGVVVSAVVFGLVHYTWGPTGMVQTAFMGLALAISYLLVRRNLWVLILAHAYLDTILILQMYFGAAQGAG